MGNVWLKRSRPTPDDLAVPNDIGEARAIRAETRTELADLRQQAPTVRRTANILISRQGKNHYMDTLYYHAPRA